ncbi:hypothetical protein D3C77_345480 [compost metagenome]
MTSPSPLIKCAPDGGLIRSMTAVSSIPLAITLMLTLPPVSQLVRLLEPYIVAPVPYIIRFELNGSISKSPIIQPSFGEASGGEGMLPKSSHGAAEIFCVYRSVRFGYPSQSQIRLQVAPPSVLRKMMASGHHELSVATIIVFEC